VIPPSPDGRHPAYRLSIPAVRNVSDDSGNIPDCVACFDRVDLDGGLAPSLFSINP
jgi:hypothetical protein